MPRVTKPIRVEASYYDKIEAEATRNKRPMGYQVEILWDYFEEMQEYQRDSFKTFGEEHPEALSNSKSSKLEEGTDAKR